MVSVAILVDVINDSASNVKKMTIVQANMLVSLHKRLGVK